MSDYSITIVPKQSEYIDHQDKAIEILNWLVRNDIVSNNLSDCVLGSNRGYPISHGAKLVTDDPDNLPFDLIINGLSVTTDRCVFDTGENGIEQIICPTCSENIAEQDWDLTDWSNEVDNCLSCPLCNIKSEIHNFEFVPEWGFSNLGFTFWNWPKLTDKFVEEFKAKLGCDISVVYQHI